MDCSVAKKRSLVAMAILFFVTCGIYFFYWMVKTKEKLNCHGGDIPTALLLIIPIANFYFCYRYAQVFTAQYRPQSEPVLYMLLLGLFPVVGMLVVQDIFNRSQRCCE